MNWQETHTIKFLNNLQFVVDNNENNWPYRIITVSIHDTNRGRKLQENLETITKEIFLANYFTSNPPE